MASQFAPDGGPKSNIQIPQTVIPTIKVRRLEDGAEYIINSADFNEDLYEEIAPAKKVRRAAKEAEEETETEIATTENKTSKRPKI